MKEIEKFRLIADLEAEESILEGLLFETKNDIEKISLYKKDLRNIRTRLTKLRTQINKEIVNSKEKSARRSRSKSVYTNEVDSNEVIDSIDIYANDIFSLEFALNVKDILKHQDKCLVKYKKDISQQDISIIRSMLDLEVNLVQADTMEIKDILFKGLE